MENQTPTSPVKPYTTVVYYWPNRTYNMREISKHQFEEDLKTIENRQHYFEEKRIKLTQELNNLVNIQCGGTRQSAKRRSQQCQDDQYCNQSTCLKCAIKQVGEELSDVENYIIIWKNEKTDYKNQFFAVDSSLNIQPEGDLFFAD